MPYITPEWREIVDIDINALIETLSCNIPKVNRDGVMNYIITKLVKSMYEPSYIEYNAAIGVLECAKLEMYRVVISKYEDQKAKENGDV